MAKFRRFPALLSSAGLFFAILLHGIYDFFLFLNDIPALAIVAFSSLGAGVALSFISMHKSAAMSPFRLKREHDSTGTSSSE
jgi:hypothetical protein